MSNCIFCKIVSGEIPTEKVYESKTVIGFKDLHPIGPTHILFVPKKHYEHLNDVPSGEFDIFKDLMHAVTETAEKEKILESGYRVVANTNKDAGQEIFHLHVHLIGGKRLGGMG